MADEQSVQLLAFTFVGQTFAFERLEQGLKRSLLAFISTIRGCPCELVKADKCAQNVDDVGTA